ncbi:MAG: anthranilate phosphoribosyltransferase [Rhodothalassiaceae bacterium]|nr:MAG: anthranilate phosphoribosyltransferase [Rhodothalassiaceae bacterium]
MTAFRAIIAALAEGRRLAREEARAAFDMMMRGDVGEIEMAAFVMALRVRGETVDEITGGVEALRARGSRIPAPPGTIDTCGTGGDGLKTLNVSTAVAIVVAAAGVPVAKHGNRAVSSACGSADVLEALGVPLEQEEAEAARTLSSLGICFLLAPRHHRAMRHVAPVRKALGIRTIFNILGPMANPAGARRQLIGVYDRRWLQPMAETLRALGTERAWLVHGSDGMDELTVTGPSEVVALEEDGRIHAFTVAPEDAGLARHPGAELAGGDAAANAAALVALLEGRPGAYRDIVLLNAAAALLIAGRVPDLEAGAKLAAETIDSGAARALLARWRAAGGQGQG